MDGLGRAQMAKGMCQNKWRHRREEGGEGGERGRESYCKEDEGRAAPEIGGGGGEGNENKLAEEAKLR